MSYVYLKGVKGLLDGDRGGIKRRVKEQCNKGTVQRMQYQACIAEIEELVSS